MPSGMADNSDLEALIEEFFIGNEHFPEGDRDSDFCRRLRSGAMSLDVDGETVAIREPFQRRSKRKIWINQDLKEAHPQLHSVLGARAERSGDEVKPVDGDRLARVWTDHENVD